MSASHFFRIGKLKNNNFLVALMHNKRELQEHRSQPHIDSTKTVLNYSLTDLCFAKKIETEAKVKMLRAGIVKPRVNAVIAVEVLFSLPTERHEQDTKPFFLDCFEWVNRTFDGEMLSFDVHLDESAPHAHAIILPLVDGRMQGNAMVGNISNLNRLRNSFFKEVGESYALSRREKKRINAKDKELLAILVMNSLRNDSLENSVIRSWIRDMIYKDPIPCAQILGIETQKITVNKIKSFVDIKRSCGKGEFVR